MAIKKISEFTSGTPTASDKILFEQGGSGKSAKVEDLGKAIGINLDLLWTNANPYSSFPEQTISLDLSKYKVIVISVCDYGADVTRRDNIQTTFILKNVSSHLFSTYLNQDIGSIRYVLASENNISFSNALDAKGNSNNLTTIPQKIWGIK